MEDENEMASESGQQEKVRLLLSRPVHAARSSARLLPSGFLPVRFCSLDGDQRFNLSCREFVRSRPRKEAAPALL